MFRILFGIFVILHGLVHLLYYAQSARIFELQPGMTWPEDSWVFARLLGSRRTRALAGVMCAVAAFGFAAGGLGFLARADWGRLVLEGMALFSSLVFVCCWDGTTKKLSEQGLIALLINLVILAAMMAFGWF